MKDKRKNEDLENVSVFQKIISHVAALLLIGPFLLIAVVFGIFPFQNRQPLEQTQPAISYDGPNCVTDLSQMGDSIYYRVSCILLLDGTATITFYKDGQVVGAEEPNIGTTTIAGPFIESSGNVSIPDDASSVCINLELENSPSDTLCSHVR